MIIAIDGPAASGKGTLAQRVADHFELRCLDTGLLYRAVARDLVTRGFQLDDAWAAVAAARHLDPKTFDDPALRGAAAGDKASIVARIPEVRAALLAYQRDFARQSPGAVLDGRDIGTVVCPDADVKIFVTATSEVRAQRRFLEHQSRGEAIRYEAVLADIKARDERDTSRAVAPLKPAADALLLDTTGLDREAAFDAAVALVEQRTGRQVAASR
ncbi:MAG: (d)CMP kinase [Hyphomicrobium sp.]